MHKGDRPRKIEWGVIECVFVWITCSWSNHVENVLF